jgi:hypothetical protein
MASWPTGVETTRARAWPLCCKHKVCVPPARADTMRSRKPSTLSSLNRHPSTRSALRALTTKPQPSRVRGQHTDHRRGRRSRHCRRPHLACSGRADGRRPSSLHRLTPVQATGADQRKKIWDWWGGWGSNPGPTDYECPRSRFGRWRVMPLCAKFSLPYKGIRARWWRDTSGRFRAFVPALCPP